MKARYSVSDTAGSRSHMEDRWFCQESSGTLQAAVFDGHGGCQVSEYCNKIFPVLGKELSQKALSKGLESPADLTDVQARDCIKDFFARAQSEIESHESLDEQGSTAVYAFLDLKRGSGFLACVGDSKILTFDGQGRNIRSLGVHKHTDPVERKRLRPFFAREPDLLRTSKGIPGNLDSALAEGHVFRLRGRLAMTRSMGDRGLKTREEKMGLQTSPLISVPDVYRFEAESSKSFVVLCSDGLSDVLTDQEVARVLTGNFGPKDPAYLQRHPGKTPAAQLVESARLKQKNHCLSDNCTVLVLVLEQ